MRPKKLSQMGPRQLANHQWNIFESRAAQFMHHLKFRSLDTDNDTFVITLLQKNAYYDGMKHQRMLDKKKESKE